MTKHQENHPYGNLIAADSRYMIVGTFPISKSSKENKFDFYYGGKRNHLWRLIGEGFGVTLNSTAEIKKFLKRYKIAVADVIKSCSRKDGLSSDSDLKDITFNTELKSLIEKSHITHLFFTSARSRLWFESKIGCNKPVVKKTLISPSASGLRCFTVEHERSFRNWLIRHPGKTRSDFRNYFYKIHFNKKKFTNNLGRRGNV